MKKQKHLNVHGLPLPALKILITLLLAAGMAHVQQKQITGQLKNVSGEVIPYASVLLTNNEGLILKFCTSDGSGTYVVTAIRVVAQCPFSTDSQLPTCTFMAMTSWMEVTGWRPKSSIKK
jgi:hypothetical protein